ncbi:MAG: ABC transporter permease [Candidatus Cloacimonetes bacterium]|nr:ABC transporter permease [Candidatus Cloacimonadota bacterium]
MNSTERFFISRYLHAPKRNLFRFSFIFMILGIVLSVGILSAGLNLFEGYERALKSVLLDSFAHLKVERSNGMYMQAEVVARVESVLGTQKEISSLTPGIGFNVMAVDEDNTRGCIFNAYEPAQGKDPLYHKYVVKGSSHVEEGQVVIGQYLADDYRLTVGDSLRVLYPQLNRITPMGIYSGEHFLQVVGIYRSGFYEYDRGLIIGTLTDARNILFTNDLYSSVEVRLKSNSIEDVSKLAYQYSLLLGPELAVYPTVSTSLLQTITMQKWLIFIVFCFLVLIAGINVISAVITMIYDKQNEIAVLKTLGASNATIRKVINYQIYFVCLAAIIIGQAFGALLSWFVVKQGFYHLKGEVYFIDKLEHYISGFNLLVVFLVAAALTAICVWIPSRRINKLQIIDLLRNQ